MMSAERTPDEMALMDQELARGDDILRQMVAAYRQCLHHEEGGDAHALEETSLEVLHANPTTITSLLVCAIRRRALDEEASDARA